MKCPCGEPELPSHDSEQHDLIVELEWEATRDPEFEGNWPTYPSVPELSWYDPEQWRRDLQGGTYYWENDRLHHDRR